MLQIAGKNSPNLSFAQKALTLPIFAKHMPTALFYLPPDLAHYYPQCALDNTDQARLAKHPALANRLTWQTSRVGKHLARQLYPHARLCLSHKNGHSLIAVGAQKAGVDLEYICSRDYLALAEKICSDEENAYLRNSNPSLRQQWFYRLWTMKEALIKAQDLRFPTDMSSIGFTWQNGQTQARLTRAETQLTWLSAQIDNNWIFSAIWFYYTQQITLHTPTALTLTQLITSTNIEITQQALPSLD